jgi:hypothetical protein
VTWLTPMVGVWLALAVIPPLIILYFLKLRRRPQAISTTLLWKKSIEDLRANAPFQKLRRSLLLLLQLMALLLLAFSVMQPQIQAGQQKGGKYVMLIDNSASMTSTDVTEPGKDATRLAEAKRRAKEKIESMYGGGLLASTSGETMIVVFSDRAEVYSRFTSSKQQLLAAIDRIQPTHGQTRIEEALKLARAYTTNVNPDQVDRPIADPATLELYSDGRISDAGDQVLRDETLNYHAIGSLEAGNVSIATISVERPYDRPTAVEVFVSLLNFNRERVTCDLQLAVDDRARAVEEVTIAAAEIDEKSGVMIPGRANVVFTPFEQPRGVVIHVKNLREDDLDADNTAFLIVPAPRLLTVAIVCEGDPPWPLRNAIESANPQQIMVLSPAEFERLAGESTLDRFDVIVLNNYQPTNMPPARYLTFGATPPLEGLNEYGEGDAQIILTARDDHPVLRIVPYDRLFISKFKLLQPSQEIQVLMEGTRGPAMVAISRGPMQVIHCTFDIMDTNWPIERSFVNFMVNALDYLGHSGEGLTSKSLAPGEAITSRLPATTSNIDLVSPDHPNGEPLKTPDPAQFAWGPIRLAGLYVLGWKMPDGSTESRPFAVNMFSETEGRIAVNPSLEIGQEQIAGRRADEAVYTPLWPWAIGFCLMVLMLEWWVYHRKAYI